MIIIGSVISLLLLLWLPSTVLSQCNLPVDITAVAFNEWSMLAPLSLSGPRYSDNAKFAAEPVPSTSNDRIQTTSMWTYPGGKMAAAFTVRTYSGTRTGFMASVVYNGVLVTQTGMAGWNISTQAPPSGSQWTSAWYQPDASWSPAVSCGTAVPAGTNAFGQLYTDQVTAQSLSASRPQWIAPGGACTGQSGAQTYYVRVVFTLPTFSACPYTDPVFYSLSGWTPIVRYNVGAVTPNSTWARVHVGGDDNYQVYLDGYGARGVDYWWGLTTELTVNLSRGKHLLAARAFTVPDTNNGPRGIIASLFHRQQLLAATDGRSKWKMTTSAALASAGWNTNVNFDTTGWLDLNSSSFCPNQDSDYQNIRQLFATFGGCPQWSFYPSCASNSPAFQMFLRYTFDLSNTSTATDAAQQSTPQQCRTSNSAPCPAGTYQTADGMYCDNCPYGTYKAISSNAACSACPSGATPLTDIAATGCQCKAGYSGDGVTCTPCAPGTYKLGAGNTQCVSCGNAGGYASCGGASFQCAAGYTVSADGFSCVACPVGTFKATVGNGQCSACPAGTSTISAGTDSAASCACDAGREKQGDLCAVCAAQTYKPAVGNGTACSVCPDNSQCSTKDYVCNAGFTADTDMDPPGCQQCSAGTYKPAAGNDRCTLCPPGATTALTAAKSSTDCVCKPGFEQNGRICSSCADGWVKATEGNSLCYLCSLNADQCSATSMTCAVGYTLSEDGKVCLACALGSYKHEVGNQPCTQCTVGSTVDECKRGDVVDSGAGSGDTTSGALKSGGGTAAASDSGSSGVNFLMVLILIVVLVVLGVAVLAYVVRRTYPQLSAELARQLSKLSRGDLTTGSSSAGGSGKNTPSANSRSGSTDQLRKLTLPFVSSWSSSSRDSAASHTATVTEYGSTLRADNTEIAIPGYLQFSAGRDFRWERCIAKGGGGEIFVGQGFASQLTKQSGGVLAVKIVAQSRDSISPKAVTAFEQEIAVMHYLGKHRNIATLLGWCDQPLALLLKYYQMGSLVAFIRAGHLATKAQTLFFAKDICSALLFMHGKWVAHRDIKPDNVFIDLDGNGEAVCVMGDFGIANIFSGQAAAVEGFNIINVNGLTITYSAPEVMLRYRARNNKISKEDAFRGDIFSTAVLMYYLLCKREAWTVTRR